ncbi:MAG: SAM-dependent methyltransferase [Patescibacteria group bacterium]
MTNQIAQLAIIDQEPDFTTPVSQLCTESQFKTTAYKYWCEEIGRKPRFHRKQWEFCYILQALSVNSMIEVGKKGLGFGVGKEPIPSVLAKRDCKILASDLHFEKAKDKGWAKTNQHSRNIEDLNIRNICNREKFITNVDFREVNMNSIDKDLIDFDFTWSSCAFEHLGSIEKGLNFVKNSLNTLKPGGIAVHTTEFNVSSNDVTRDNAGTVLFRRKDIEKLAQDCTDQGHFITLNFNVGTGEIDQYIDVPPYTPNKQLKKMTQLKIDLEKYVTTSIGLIIKKKLA